MQTIIQVNTMSVSNIFSKKEAELYQTGLSTPYLGGWNKKLTIQLQSLSEEYAYECWGIEKNLANPFEWEDEGITFRLFPSTSVKYVGEYSRSLLGRLSKERKRETLVAVHEPFSVIGERAPSAVRHKPIIAQHHGGLSSLLQVGQNPEIWKKLGYFLLWALKGEWFFERYEFPRYDHFFVLSDDVKRYFVRYVGERKVEKLSMGTDFEKYYPIEREHARRLIGLNEGDHIILYVGSLVRVKGLSDLLQAFSTVRREYPNALLLLVGQGYLREQLVDLAKRLGVSEGVRFIPAENDGVGLSDEELLVFYNAADVFVLPSLNEGVPVVGMEALACETPFVATSVGGTPDLVGAFDAGTLVPPRDSNALAHAVIERLRTHSFTVDRQKAEKRYAWKHIAKRHLEVYRRLFDEYYR